ncbi:MAG: calcineurin-like phosphoesterase C-terminal domain-containing protein, partial [Muribaculaceae bacterium]|nr:calcineurin-like phosphoesterase C-terminal domain-containing protein [Muribaculaceae bacterium]
CTDGSPAGYGVWEINGRDMQGYYKSNCKDRDYQFRVYDLNTVLIPNEKYAGEYSRRNRNNEILVNVFGYAPGWTVEITEQGSPLKVSQVYCQDPLYLMINGIPQMEEGVKGYKFPKPVSHMFKATASAADSPVTVRVTDAAGRVYTQTVERPKHFHKDMQ